MPFLCFPSFHFWVVGREVAKGCLFCDCRFFRWRKRWFLIRRTLGQMTLKTAGSIYTVRNGKKVSIKIKARGVDRGRTGTSQATARPSSI